MLLSINKLLSFSAYGSDGDLGDIEDFYFEDSTWTVRYIVVRTGPWINHKYSLVSPLSIAKDFDLKNQRIELDLTKAQIKQAPPADLAKPISEQFERQFFKHYKKRPYWEGEKLWADSDILTEIRGKVSSEKGGESKSANLRSAKEVINYDVQALDGDIGYIKDFVIDEESWKIRYLVIDIRKWLTEKLVTVSPDWCKSIDWLNEKAVLDVKRKAIKDAPSFEPDQPINRSYETKIYDYYARPVYWKGSKYP